VQVLAQPQLKQQLAKQGFETRSSSPAELKAIIEKDLARWERVVKENRIRIEQ
jgi:tripartite-type tricarboxylate transporter receptor subunit TctC